MSDYLMVGDRARWEVMWVVKKPKQRIVCIEFENDFSGALQLYLKAKQAGKTLATLRCCNVGFPPPEKYHPFFREVKTDTGKTKVVRRHGRKVRKKIYKIVTEEVMPMDTLNREHGVWWCPYCREMRKFQHWDGVMTDGSFFRLIETKDPLWIPHPGMFCPMCGINQNDSHVRRWNPQATELMYRFRQRSRRGTRTRSSRSRSR